MEDTEKRNANTKEEIKAIETEEDRIRREQANIISIMPAAQQNTRIPGPDKSPTEKNAKARINRIAGKQNSHFHRERKLETKAPYSIASSATSQEFHNSPGNDEILDPYSDDLINNNNKNKLY